MNWLMLRGLAREQRHWGSFAENLAEALPGHRFFCLDAPGTGTEFRRESPQTVDDIMEDLRSRWLLLREHHQGPWAIFGISLGGMLTQAWCGRYPEDFERAVIVNTSASNVSSPLRRLNPGALAGIAQAMFESDPMERERRILGFTSAMRTTEELDAWRRVTSTFLLDRPILRATVLRQILAGARFQAPASLHIPTLVLTGARDVLANPDCSRALARRYRATLHVHPLAGHDLALDDPNWLAWQVRDWLGVTAAPAAKATPSDQVEVPEPKNPVAPAEAPAPGTAQTPQTTAAAKSRARRSAAAPAQAPFEAQQSLP